jgi:hypothetical protein
MMENDSTEAHCGGPLMLEDAVYYSRREADERALANVAADERVKQIHLLLADKYVELAKRELARVEADQAVSPRSISADDPVVEKRAFPGIR